MAAVGGAEDLQVDSVVAASVAATGGAAEDGVYSRHNRIRRVTPAEALETAKWEVTLEPRSWWDLGLT